MFPIVFILELAIDFRCGVVSIFEVVKVEDTCRFKGGGSTGKKSSSVDFFGSSRERDVDDDDDDDDKRGKEVEASECVLETSEGFSIVVDFIYLSDDIDASAGTYA